MSFSRCLLTSALLHCMCCHVVGLEYLNLAKHYRRNVEHSYISQSEHSNGEQNAVAGFIDQDNARDSCTFISSGNPFWWRIQFTERVYIQRIVIYRAFVMFKGSKVYISENGDCDGNLVYTRTADPTNPRQDILDIPVKADGTYVVICNKSRKMFVCEVQIIGCPYGRYGDQCALTCGNCHLSTCHLANGSCPGDCGNEYMGPMCNTSCIGRCKDSNCTMDGCTDCVDGKHGVYCDRQCPPNCESGTCSQHGGACIGCKQYKYWGEKCSNLCPLNCNDEMCAQRNGVCHGCTDSFWGTWCNKTCPKNCDNGICSRTNGYCSNDCTSRYWGRQCEHDCPINCKNGECTKNGGLCAGGCEPGYYGDVCDGQCGRCTDDLCDQYTGVCDGDCRTDYWGDHCNHTCPNCLKSVCSKDTGICGRGCSAGYRGYNCTEKCETGSYGFGCSEKCGNCFDGNVSCLHIDGKCIEGCIAPFIGHSCQSIAEVPEKNQSGDQGIGLSELIGGLLGGVSVAVLAFGIFIYFRRFRRIRELSSGGAHTNQEHISAPKRISSNNDEIDDSDVLVNVYDTIGNPNPEYLELRDHYDLIESPDKLSIADPNDGYLQPIVQGTGGESFEVTGSGDGDEDSPPNCVCSNDDGLMEMNIESSF